MTVGHAPERPLSGCERSILNGRKWRIADLAAVSLLTGSTQLAQRPEGRHRWALGYRQCTLQNAEGHSLVWGATGMLLRLRVSNCSDKLVREEGLENAFYDSPEEE